MAQSRKQKIREDLIKQRRRRRTITLTTAVAAIALVVIVIIILLQPRPAPPGSVSLIGKPISQTLYTEISGVGNSTLNSVVGTAGVTPLVSISGTPLTNNKPEFLYIGADFCPFCAAERWSMIEALSKFGTFTNGTIVYMLSSDAAGEVYPNTATFSFSQAVYTSNWVSFVPVETLTRDRTTLQTPTSQEKAVWDTYDSGENIPFIDIGNSSSTQYLINNQNHSGSQYLPDVLAGLNWTQIGSQLSNPSSNVARRIGATADTMISAICKLDGGMPTSICQQGYAQLVQAPFPLASQEPFPDPSVYLQGSDSNLLALKLGKTD